MSRECAITLVGWCLACPALAAGADAVRSIEVTDNTTLRAAMCEAKPGSRIRIAPGNYTGGLYVERLTGTERQPIVIEAHDPARPPVILGGTVGFHLPDAAHVTLCGLVFRGQSGNGVNIDDSGSYDTPAHHVSIEHVVFDAIGPKGNRDALKLSGVDDFVVRQCTFNGWGGSAIDMVGCHRGSIEGCDFRGTKEFPSDTGVQAKGGTAEVSVRRCTFSGPIARGINLGGSTGLEFFRPRDVLTCGARDLTVEGCTFRPGLDAAVAFVGVDGATVRYNTIERPNRWAVRILQETVAPGFVPCRNGRFEHNVIVFHRAAGRDAINIGPDTQPQSFMFAGNWWYCPDEPKRSRPDLPTAETGGTYGLDPKLSESADVDVIPTNPAAGKVGAWSLPN